MTASHGEIRPKTHDLPGAQIITEAVCCLLETAIKCPSTNTAEVLAAISASLREAAAMIGTEVEK